MLGSVVSVALIFIDSVKDALVLQDVTLAVNDVTLVDLNFVLVVDELVCYEHATTPHGQVYFCLLLFRLLHCGMHSKVL